MATLETPDNTSSQAWQSFIQYEELTPEQAEQFKVYLQELLAWNENINLTSIETVRGILNYHFQDSLHFRKVMDLHGTETICDVGSGGGFPGIPLKICYPELTVVLLEVNNKKIAFLEHVIDTLGLEGVEICDQDWRTFLRKAPFPTIDYFLARASLRPDELLRAFKSGCVYRDATIVYWAAKEWHAESKEAPFVTQEIPYVVGNRKRKLIVLGNQGENK